VTPAATDIVFIVIVTTGSGVTCHREVVCVRREALVASSLVSEVIVSAVDAGQMGHVAAGKFVGGEGAVKEIDVADRALPVEGVGYTNVVVLGRKKG
jgi:hypothetical protein